MSGDILERSKHRAAEWIAAIDYTKGSYDHDAIVEHLSELRYNGRRPLVSVADSADQAVAAVMDGRCYVWDRVSGQLLAQFRDQVDGWVLDPLWDQLWAMGEHQTTGG